VAFVNALKDGKEFDDALQAHLKGTRDQLIPAFGKWLGIRLEN
jgi:hypothetical protein